MPQISVIVPVYKVEKYLHRCVDSILAQTYTDFELILVDDGSPDNCGAICDECAQKDSRIVVIHQANGGLSAARNAGIDWAFANSDSEWLVFIDSDDWIYRRTLEILLGGVARKECHVVIGKYQNTSGDDPVVDENRLSVERWSTAHFFRIHTVNAVVAWGKLYRKNLFHNIRYPVGKIHEDEFTTHKLLFQTENVAYVNQPLYAYFQNETGIMNTRKIMDAFTKLDAEEERITFFQDSKKQEMFEWQLRNYILDIYHIQAKLMNDNRQEELLARDRMYITLRKYRKDVFHTLNFYEKFSLCLMASRIKLLRKWVVHNDFEPIQNLIRKIKQ